MNSSPPTLRERVNALRYVPSAVALVWETSRGLTLAMVSLRVVRGLVPVTTLWIAKLIVDAVVSARAAGADWWPILNLILLEVGIVLVAEVVTRISGVVDTSLADLFTIRISVRLMDHTAKLDLPHLEDPSISDQLERARRQTTGRLGLLSQIMGITQNGITLATISVVLVQFNYWLLVLLAVAMLPGFLAEGQDSQIFSTR